MRCWHRERRLALALLPYALLPCAVRLLGPLAAATAERPTRTAYRGISSVELTGREDAGETDDLNAQADDAVRGGDRESIHVVATGVSDFPWRLRVREHVDTTTGHTNIKTKVSRGRQYLLLQALGYDGDIGTADSDQGADLVRDVLRLLHSETRARMREPPAESARKADDHEAAESKEVAHPALGRQAREVRVFVEEGISGRRKKHRKTEKPSRRRRPAQLRGPELRPHSPPPGSGGGRGGQAGPPQQAPLGFWLLLSFGCGGVAMSVFEKVRRRRRVREMAEMNAITGIPLEASHLVELDGLNNLAQAGKDKLERLDYQLRKFILHKDTWHDADRSSTST